MKLTLILTALILISTIALGEANIDELKQNLIDDCDYIDPNGVCLNTADANCTHNCTPYDKTTASAARVITKTTTATGIPEPLFYGLGLIVIAAFIAYIALSG